MFDSDGDGGSEAPDDVLDAEAHANANRDDATEPAVNDDVVSDADSCVDGSGVAQASDDEPTTPRSGELEAPCASSHDGEDAAHDDDLLAMLAAWGTNDPAADVNGDGVVNVNDLMILLSNY